MIEQRIIHGDCFAQLLSLSDESIDLIVTDPPYGYSFMGKSWDKTLPDISIFKECLRVLKPGAFAFVMSAPRSDVCARMMLLLEDAGFNIGFTPIYWTYASGFPKAMNIGKMVDKRNGTHKPIMIPTKRGNLPEMAGNVALGATGFTNIPERVSDEAKALDGSYGGFQPKPAVEVVIVAMKPLTLMSYLITLGSRAGDMVLDPFCGSGTTCIAAKQLGRASIGIEREKEYVDIAEARLKTIHQPLI